MRGPFSPSAPFLPKAGALLGSLAGLLGLLLATRYDVIWSRAAQELAAASPTDARVSRLFLGNGAPMALQSFLNVMDRSLFEGSPLGASDVPLLLQIAAFFAYLWTFRSQASHSMKRWRPAWAYMWVTALVTAAGVHLCKGLVARPRPYAVFGGMAPFLSWFDVQSPQFFAFGKGSFPSGHTAMVMTLWTTVLILRRQYPQRLLLRGAWALLCLVLAGAMAFSRVARGDHWPTDTLASIGFTWVVCHSLAAMMLPLPVSKGPRARETRTDPAWHLSVLLLWCGLWVTCGLSYLAVKLTLTGSPALGAVVFVASFGGGYGVSVARTRRSWSSGLH